MKIKSFLQDKHQQVTIGITTALILGFVVSSTLPAAYAEIRTTLDCSITSQPIGPIDCSGRVFDTSGFNIPQGGTVQYSVGEIITYQCVKHSGNTQHGVGNIDTLQKAITFSGSIFLPNPNLGGGGFTFTIGSDQQPTAATLTCPKQNQVAQITGTQITTQTAQYIVP